MRQTNASNSAEKELSYGRACAAWRDSFERYLTLARRGASAAALREAANAVHQAALDKGRLETDDTEH